MYLNILLHGSHLVIQFGQTWHQLTYLSSVEKTGRRPLWSIMYLLQTLLSDNQDSIMVSAKSFPDRSTRCLYNLGSRFIKPHPAPNHESYGQRVPIYKVRRRTAIPTWSRWWRNLLTGWVYRGYSTRQMKLIGVKYLQHKIVDNRTVNRQLWSGRKRKVIWTKCSAISVTCCWFCA